MAMHVLPSDTLISSLSLASNDTIDLNGHSLIVDADAAATPVTLTNAGGVDCNLELRDLGRIKLNATLPATIHPWIDPAHPLPVAAEPGIDGDPYRTPLTANARAEIQLNGAFDLGGGPASFPTATRAGNFWALLERSSAANSLTFDRDFPLHPGDVIFNASIQANNTNNTVVVTAYDAATRTATISSNSATRTVGNLWGLIAGGVLIYLAAYSSSTPRISADTIAGTLNILGYSAGANAAYAIGTKATIIADRIGFKGQNVNTNAEASGLVGEKGIVVARQVIADPLFAGTRASPKYLAAAECATWRQQANDADVCVSNGGFVYNLTCARLIKNTKIGNLNIGGCRFGFIRAVSCTIQNEAVPDTQFEISGTVTRTARTDFPTDTDLPDAQYHATNAADAVTWRYEDRWVRKGETLRMRARWMPAGAASTASVAIAELSTWWPDLWPLGAEALAKAEFAAGMEQLTWHDGAVEWRNDTGEDCQVRVWECVSGDTLGGYLRVWTATGGAL